MLGIDLIIRKKSVVGRASNIPPNLGICASITLIKTMITSIRNVYSRSVDILRSNDICDWHHSNSSRVEYVWPICYTLVNIRHIRSIATKGGIGITAAIEGRQGVCLEFWVVSPQVIIDDIELTLCCSINCHCFNNAIWVYHDCITICKYKDVCELIRYQITYHHI